MSSYAFVDEVAVNDFVRGATFFSTGGGGSPEDGLIALNSEFEKGKNVGWVDIGEIPDSALVVCPFMMGSIAPHTPEVKQEMATFGLVEGKPKYVRKEGVVEAIKTLEEFTHKKISAVIPLELGGSNTSVAVAAAASLGLPCINGDYAGRAIPEISQTIPSILGKALCPIASVDLWSNKTYIESTISYAMAERIGKLISVAAYGPVSQAGFLLPVREVKECYVPNTLAECLNVGSTIRKARETGEDPIIKVKSLLNAWILFRGIITEKEWGDKEGYYWGTHTITGEKQFTGHKFKIWFKNENHISWIDDKPYVTSPDMLIMVDDTTGEPIPNPFIKEGDSVAVIGVRAREQFRNERGINILEPAHFGFKDIKHIPIEELTKIVE